VRFPELQQQGGNMNVYELRRALENVPDDAEVKMAHQPAYPLEYDVGNVVVTGKDLELVYESGESISEPGWYIVNHNEDPQDEEFWVFGPTMDIHEANKKLTELEGDFEPVVYIVEGNDQGYLSDDAVKAVGW
jgi:hypothetical protein